MIAVGAGGVRGASPRGVEWRGSKGGSGGVPPYRGVERRGGQGGIRGVSPRIVLCDRRVERRGGRGGPKKLLCSFAVLFIRIRISLSNDTFLLKTASSTCRGVERRGGQGGFGGSPPVSWC